MQIPRKQVLQPLAEKRGLDTWEKIVAFTGDEWFPSRIIFGKFKGSLYQEARENGELRAWRRKLSRGKRKSKNWREVRRFRRRVGARRSLDGLGQDAPVTAVRVAEEGRELAGEVPF